MFDIKCTEIRIFFNNSVEQSSKQFRAYTKFIALYSSISQIFTHLQLSVPVSKV